MQQQRFPNPTSMMVGGQQQQNESSYQQQHLLQQQQQQMRMMRVPQQQVLLIRTITDLEPCANACKHDPVYMHWKMIFLRQKLQTCYTIKPEVEEKWS